MIWRKLDDVENEKIIEFFTPPHSFSRFSKPSQLTFLPVHEMYIRKFHYLPVPTFHPFQPFQHFFLVHKINQGEIKSFMTRLLDF